MKEATAHPPSHASAVQHYVSPRDFLGLIRAFVALVNEKRAGLEDQQVSLFFRSPNSSSPCVGFDVFPTSMYITVLLSFIHLLLYVVRMVSMFHCDSVISVPWCAPGDHESEASGYCA